MRTWIAICLLGSVWAADQKVKGWHFDGPQADYEGGVDRTVTHGGRASGFLRGIVAKPRNHAALIQVVSAEAYRGKRVRFSAWMKAEDADMARLALHVDVGENGAAIAAGQEDVHGTSDWQRREVVLDIEPSATRLTYGLGLFGAGRAWIDDVQIEVVDKSVPTTDKLGKWPTNPSNLDFEE